MSDETVFEEVLAKLGINLDIFAPTRIDERKGWIHGPDKVPESPRKEDVKVEEESAENSRTELSDTDYTKAEYIKQESIKTVNPVVKHTKRYPRRGSKKLKTYAGIAPGTPWVPKRSETCFRDVILAKVDPYQYHAFIDYEYKEPLIRLANKTLPSQIERFEYESKPFIIVTWLTTLRIYEYYPNDRGNYVEVKRIPERFIKISRKLVTSLHYNDSKIYIAYLGGCEHDGLDSNKPYLEIRNLNGELLGKPRIYDEAITKIHSDHDFIYLLTKSDFVYIHRKKFLRPTFKVMLKPLITSPLTGFRIDSNRDLNHTKLKLLFTSANELVISNYDVFEHQVIHCFRFEGLHKIISLEKVDRLYIIHRNLPDAGVRQGPTTVLSRIEFGFTSRTSKDEDFHFVHELTVSFRKHIVKIKAFKENLYILGYVQRWGEKRLYQVGCIYMPSPKPLWIQNLEDVDDDCHILAHDNNIVIIKTCQRISCIKIEANAMYECKECKIKFLDESNLKIHELGDHESIFSDFNVFKNKYLQDLGASVFKKMITANKSDGDQIGLT